jgi:hypothetical protein
MEKGIKSNSGKFQITNPKYQTNHNDQNSKFQTLKQIFVFSEKAFVSSQKHEI